MNHPRLSIIPARAATDRAIKARDLQVLCVLGRHTDDLGWCRRSQVKMAAEMDCARSTVFESIERLVAAGYLERHVQETENGRDSAHMFRVILDPVHPNIDTVCEPDDPCRYTGTPAGISAPPAGAEPAPPAGSGPAPINDPSLTTPSNKERGRASGNENREAISKALERSFFVLVKGWPGSEGMPTGEALRHWCALSDEQRSIAQDKRDAWLQALRSQSRKHIPVPSTYVRERLWESVPDVVPKSRPSTMEARPFGKLWSADRLRLLFEKPTGVFLRLTPFEQTMVANGKLKEADLIHDKRTRTGWPIVNEMHAKARDRSSFWVNSDIEACASSFVPVKVGSDEWEAWEREHKVRGWPWLPDPGQQEWVYFPAGGPDGLKEFEQAVQGNGNNDKQ